jgi:hypothetical protein
MIYIKTFENFQPNQKRPELNPHEDLAPIPEESTPEEMQQVKTKEEVEIEEEEAVKKVVAGFISKIALQNS